jgi:voltage-gated potassium channel
MAARDERARTTAEKHETREARIESWLDRRMNRKGMRPRFAAYLVIAAWFIAIIAFGIIERIVDPHSFKTIWLAWWWAVQTVTTVGYGDIVPGQTAGKVIGAFLMLGGLSFLSVLTATITSSFISRRQRQAQERGEDPLMRELSALTERIDSLERELRTARTGVAAPDGSGEGESDVRPGPG